MRRGGPKEMRGKEEGKERKGEVREGEESQQGVEERKQGESGKGKR